MNSRVFGITGWKNSGKTTLTEKLVAELVAARLVASRRSSTPTMISTSTSEGADSFRHRQAGATEVAIVSGRRWALMHELRGEDEPSSTQILARLAPCDLVLVEGYKREAHNQDRDAAAGRQGYRRRFRPAIRTSSPSPPIIAVAGRNAAGLSI